MTHVLDGDGPCPVCQVIMNERAKESAIRHEWFLAEEEFAALVKDNDLRTKDSVTPVTERSPSSAALYLSKRWR